MQNIPTELDLRGVARMVVRPPAEPMPLIISPTPEQVWGEGTIQDQFEAFDRLNPWVYDILVRMTRDLVRRGRTKIGIGMLFEVLRWQYAMTTVDSNSEFKLNNNYRSRYARKIMTEYEDLWGIYEIRALHS